MKLLDASTIAALESGAIALAQLLLLEFPSGTIALNTSNWALVWDGTTYLGAAGLGAISPVSDTPGEVQGLRLTLFGGDASRISLALDAADEVQGTAVTLRTAIVSTSTYQVLAAPIDWAGTIDTMAITEDGEQAVIAASVESAAVDLLRGVPSTYSDADQQALWPGDLSMQYIVSQSDQPVVWPAKEYFYQ